MTTSWAMGLLILSCAFVTWLPRIIPFALMKSITMPKVIFRWLSYIPVCILSALVYESLFIKDHWFVTIDLLNFFAFIPTLMVAIWTKSLSKTVVAGVLSMALIQYLFL